MPQGPIAIAQQPSIGGDKSALYMNSTTVVKASAGRAVVVTVIVAGAAGSLHDCLTTASAITATEIAVIPATVGPVALNFPCLHGIVYKPGASQVASISYV